MTYQNKTETRNNYNLTVTIHGLVGNYKNFFWYSHSLLKTNLWLHCVVCIYTLKRFARLTSAKRGSLKMISQLLPDNSAGISIDLNL